MKQKAAYRAVEFVKSGMVVGLGTGSTHKFALERMADLLKTKQLEHIWGIASSFETEKMANALEIPLTTFEYHPKIDLTISGVKLSLGCRLKNFENKYLFYRFTSDEDHGKAARKMDGSAVSWADFVSPVTLAQDLPMTLQPEIPERDPKLATFSQVDLKACGISPLDEHNVRLLDNVHPKGWGESNTKV